MSEMEIDIELRKMLLMLKTIERKMAEGTIPFDKDIFAIHMAVLEGNYDMSEALEFIKCMYDYSEE